MKKFIISLLSTTAALFVLSLPTAGFASTNAFVQLIKNATTLSYPHCGKPSKSGFCHCFTDAMIAGCKREPIHPRCDAPDIKAYIDQLFHDNYHVICAKFKPPGVSAAECASDLKYWHDNFATCNQP